MENQRRRSGHVSMLNHNDGEQVNHVWSNEPVSNPLKYLYSEEEKFSKVLCPRCNGYLKPSRMDKLPFPWKELQPDGEDASCFFNQVTNQVRWTPPLGCSEAACRVFHANGTIYKVCTCRIPWKRRQYILRKIRIYATRYKEDLHDTIAIEYENLQQNGMKNSCDF